MVKLLGSTLVLIFGGLLTHSALSEGAGESVYGRAEPTRMSAGIVSIGIIAGGMADVPVSCEGGETACWETRRFPTSYELSFQLEQRERGAETTLEERGIAYILLDAPPEQADRFFDDLRSHLSSLPAESFVDSFASLRAGHRPFIGIGEITLTRSWICFSDTDVSATRYDRTMSPRGEGRSIHTDGFDVADRVCESAASLFTGRTDDQVRTVPSVQELRESSVSAEIANTVPATLWPDQLASLPEGVSLDSVDADESAGNTWHAEHSAGTFTGTRTSDGKILTVKTRAATLDPRMAQGPAWLSEWTVETTDRTFGGSPSTSVVDSRRLVVTALPIASPDAGEASMQDGASDRSVDASSLLDGVATRLDQSDALDLGSLERAIVEPPVGFGSSGWLVVVCRDDGTASFGLVPFPPQSTVENAGEFCAALEQSLQSE